MNTELDQPDGEDTADFEELLRLGVELALTEPDFAKALDRFDRELPQVNPALARMIAPGLPRRPFSQGLLREIWNNTPQPGFDWRPRPLPKPERNEPCPCGSGEKFKNCCAGLAGHAPFGDRLSLLRYVLERIPMADYANLPLKRMDPAELGFAGEQWNEDGDYEQTLALLEPLFRDVEKLDIRHEPAFDALCDAYLETGQEDQRLALLERMGKARDDKLRAVALQRQTAMLADRNDYDAAWECFAAAQRADPNNPGLSHLEVTILLAQGETERAQQRARFWASRLKKRRDVAPELIDMLEQCAEDPGDWLDRMHATEPWEDLDDDLDTEDYDEEHDEEYDDALFEVDLPRLLAAVTRLDAPECHYDTMALDDKAVALRSRPELAKLEEEWRGIFPWERDESQEADLWQDRAWIEWFLAHPLACHSFAILEDIVAAMEEVPLGGDDDWIDAEDAADAALADYLPRLIDCVLEANQAEGKELPWGCLENRPALRLIQHAIWDTADIEQRIARTEWLVFTLNPNDNQGMREELLHECLDRGQAERAWKVCERYPGDMLTGMLYGRALTLFMLGRRAEADDALRQAIAEAPEVAKILKQKTPRSPQKIAEFVAARSRDEAWLYCLRNKRVWEKSGGDEWLRGVMKR